MLWVIRLLLVLILALFDLSFKALSFLLYFFTRRISFHVVITKLMLNRIGTDFQWGGIVERLVKYSTPMLLILLGFAIHFIPSKIKSQAKEVFILIPDVAKVLVCAVIIFICYQAKTADVQPFIYFQF